MLLKRSKQLLKWQNFVKSGHTGLKSNLISDLKSKHCEPFQPRKREPGHEKPESQGPLGQVASCLDDGLGARPQAQGQARIPPGNELPKMIALLTKWPPYL